MLIIVSGPSCVGKSFTVDYLCEGYGFLTLTPYTTREPRTSEAEGVHYHFRSEKTLREVSANFSRGYWAQPLGAEWYGCSEHVNNLANDSRNWIMQAYSDIALAIKKNNPNAHTVFLDFRTEKALNERLVERFGVDAEQLSARKLHAQHERERKNEYDFQVESDNHEQIAKEVAIFALSKVIQAPSHIGTLPGPLSDIDICSLGLKFEGLSEASNITPRGWSIDLTLSPKFYRLTGRKFFKRVFDLIDGNELDVSARFKECITSDNEGIYLRPNEFILGSTQEKVTLPDNIVGLISGRSSYARLGISIDLSAIILQPGHNDTIPLQIKNNLPYPVVIYPKMSLAQIVLFRTVSHSSTPYFQNTNAKYVGRLADIRSRYYEDSIYKSIGEGKTGKHKIDWDYSLNVLLFFLICALAVSWLVNTASGFANSTAANIVQIVVFVLTMLVVITRGIILVKKRRNR